MTDKYTLNWQTFSEHLQLMLKDLYEEGKNSDVTLVSDDQTQFKAHKIVLSACSPVFKKIIDSNPSQHPLIYLRGIQSYEMESILQFMYLGEARFYNERIREFIKVAKDLEVQEISKGLEVTDDVEDITEEAVIDNEENEKKEDIGPKQTPENQIRQRQPRNQISSDAKSTECPECGKVFSQRCNMLTHYKSVHEGIKYHCNKCDYQATTQGDLQQHIQSKHEGIKYPCNQCDYHATQRVDLQTHIAAKHSDRILKCDFCDYQTKWIPEYSRHTKTHTTTV